MTDAQLGTNIPTLSLISSEGTTIKLPQDWKGKWVVLYFYPKDDTPGCTKQACSYRDSIEDFKKRGVLIYGVSLDDLTSHEKFIKKYNLNFPLLSDSNHELSQTLGVYSGKGLSRDSFLINPQGQVSEIWRKVKPDTTVSEILESLKKYL